MVSHVSVCLKEILEEVRKELHKVKDEIIAGEVQLVCYMLSARQCIYK